MTGAAAGPVGSSGEVGPLPLRVVGLVRADRVVPAGTLTNGMFACLTP